MEFIGSLRVSGCKGCPTASVIWLLFTLGLPTCCQAPVRSGYVHLQSGACKFCTWSTRHHLYLDRGRLCSSLRCQLATLGAQVRHALRGRLQLSYFSRQKGRSLAGQCVPTTCAVSQAYRQLSWDALVQQALERHLFPKFLFAKSLAALHSLFLPCLAVRRCCATTRSRAVAFGSMSNHPVTVYNRVIKLLFTLGMLICNQVASTTLVRKYSRLSALAAQGSQMPNFIMAGVPVHVVFRRADWEDPGTVVMLNNVMSKVSGARSTPMVSRAAVIHVFL
jgi:hypothetical protein